MCRWLILFLLAGCGGGSGSAPTSPIATPPPVTLPPPAPIKYDWRDYSGLRASYNASGWRSEQTGPDSFVIWWGGNGEEQRIAPNPADGGRLWVWLDAYTAPGIRYVSVTTRAEIDRMDGNGWINIQPPNNMSSPYVPVEIFGEAGIRVRTWGWIYLNGNPIKRWFWHTTIRPATDIYNSCWMLDHPTRKALFIQEAWWDLGGDNWTDRGHGDIDPVTREPSGEGIVYDYWIYNAEMINGHGGYAWRYGYTSGGLPGCATF